MMDKEKQSTSRSFIEECNSCYLVLSMVGEPNSHISSTRTPPSKTHLKKPSQISLAKGQQHLPTVKHHPSFSLSNFSQNAGPADMAEPSPPPQPATQPIEPDKPNPQPDPQPEKPTQPPSSTTVQPLPPLPPPQTTTIINPNPNPNPSSAPPLVPPLPPPHINPYGHPPPMGSTGIAVPPPSAPSFRPAGAPAPIPVPQFTPMAPNPNLQGYQTAPPPGVTSVGPPQQQQMYQGQMMRPPYMAMPNGYMGHVPNPNLQGSMPPPGVVRYPYPPIARPPFLQRPAGAIGTVSPLPRPPFLGLRPPMTLPVVRPPVLPIVTPAEKPQTTVYVGKVAPSVENEFIRSLLELCGPIKSWKRAQDPSDGTPRRFGFCEFESAEGVLRALRLLSKCNVDGEELVLNVNQGTREFLERYIEKKKEEMNKPSETGAEEAKKEGESATEVEKGEGHEKDEPAKTTVEEPKKDGNETVNKENDMSVFGLVTDEDRDADREALEKLTSMIEERIKTKPLPPPPPPPPSHKAVDGVNHSNSEVLSDTDAKNEEKNDDETTSETKPASRSGTESPDRSRRYDYRSRDRDRERDKREKERELDRLERERERERARRERERELEIQKAERFYKERVKEWEGREKDKEHKRKYEREKEKERERERRRLVAEQEDESDDDSRKRRRKSEIEDKRRRRRREKDEDLADRLKEEEEIAEAKKRAEEEEEERRQQEKDVIELPPAPVANGGEKHMSEDVSSDMKVDSEHAQESDSVAANHTGDGVVENGSNDETIMASGPTSDVKPSGNAPTKKLGFGLVGSGKRTTVPSVFHEEEDDDAQKEKKMRPLVPIDYSTEELQGVPTDDGAPPNAAVPAESGKRIPKEVKSDAERERSRRSHDRSSHRDRDRDRDGDDARAREEHKDKDHRSDKVRNSENNKIMDAKQLIDMIPKTKDDLFSFEINWAVYDENRLHERMRPWISKKITEFLGEEETTLVEFIVDRFREHVKAEKMLDVLQQILDEEAEMFVLKMWRMLIFEIKRVETGLAPKTGA